MQRLNNGDPVVDIRNNQKFEVINKDTDLLTF